MLDVFSFPTHHHFFLLFLLVYSRRLFFYSIVFLFLFYALFFFSFLYVMACVRVNMFNHSSSWSFFIRVFVLPHFFEGASAFQPPHSPGCGSFPFNHFFAKIQPPYE